MLEGSASKREGGWRFSLSFAHGRDQLEGVTAAFDSLVRGRRACRALTRKCRSRGGDGSCWWCDACKERQASGGGRFHRRWVGGVRRGGGGFGHVGGHALAPGQGRRRRGPLPPRCWPHRPCTGRALDRAHTGRCPLGAGPGGGGWGPAGSSPPAHSLITGCAARPPPAAATAGPPGLRQAARGPAAAGWLEQGRQQPAGGAEVAGAVLCQARMPSAPGKGRGLRRASRGTGVAVGAAVPPRSGGSALRAGLGGRHGVCAAGDEAVRRRWGVPGCQGPRGGEDRGGGGRCTRSPGGTQHVPDVTRLARGPQSPRPASHHAARVGVHGPRLEGGVPLADGLRSA